MIPIPGVYGPHRDSELIAKVVAEEVRPGDRVLDVCTGSGYLALTAARAGAGHVAATDVSRRAILSVRLNARLRGLAVEARRGNLLEPAGHRYFDLIVANPPYVPSVDADAPVRGASRAWEGGGNGRRLLTPLLRDAPHRLLPGGRLLIVHSSLCGLEETLSTLEEAGLTAEIVATESAPLGPITAPRAEQLERRGILMRGERSEVTAVIRAVMPARTQPDETARTPAFVSA